jgi:hypothetical protein
VVEQNRANIRIERNDKNKAAAKPADKTAASD